MSICTIGKSRARGSISAPPSKSFAHRLLISAFLSNKKVSVDNIDLSNDIAATLDCIRALGAEVTVKDRCVTICRSQCRSEVLNCRESGSTMRFMIPIALALNGKLNLCGTEKLLSRGIGEYEKIFAEQGISYEKGIRSLSAKGNLKSGVFHIDGSLSSQYITGLLFALPLLQGDSHIIITPPVNSRPYIDITISVLKQAKIDVRFEGNEIYIKGGQEYEAEDSSAEGDWSNAAFLDFYNHIGGKVEVTGLNPDSLQGDKVYRELFSKLERGRCEIDLGNYIDLGPVLFTMAAIKHGARFVNTARLRIKESDRVADIVQELDKIGVQAKIAENSVEIIPAPDLIALESKSITFDSHNDHRLAMSLSALASIFGAKIKGCEAVAKSYPAFWDDIRKLNIDVRDE